MPKPIDWKLVAEMMCPGTYERIGSKDGAEALATEIRNQGYGSKVGIQDAVSYTYKGDRCTLPPYEPKRKPYETRRMVRMEGAAR